MKRPLFCLFLMSLWIQINAQESSYFSDEMTIDGLSADWSNELLKPDKKTGFSTAIKNDSKNLYLLFQASNQASISKLLQTGMTISFKAKTKPKVNARLEYPMPATSSRGQQRSGQRQGGARGTDMSPADREAMRKQRMMTQLESKNQAKLKGFSISNGHLLLSDIEGLQMVLAFDESAEAPLLGYELQIPLEELFGLSMNWDRMTSSDLNISITVNGMERPEGFGGAGGRSGGPGGGFSGGRAGGRPPGANRGGRGQQNRQGTDMFNDQTVKLSYRIIQQ